MRQYACNPANAYVLSALFLNQVNANFHPSSFLGVPAVNGTLPSLYAYASPYLQLATPQSPIEFGISSTPALGLMPSTVYSMGIPTTINPTILFPAVTSKASQKKRVDPATVQRRNERNLRFQFYIDCLIKYLQKQPSHRCTIDEFVQMYPTLPDVLNVPKEKDGEPIIPVLTKKHRGDLVRHIRRARDLKLTPITSESAQVEDENATSKGCYVELVKPSQSSDKVDPRNVDSALSPQREGPIITDAATVGTVMGQGHHIDLRKFKVANTVNRTHSYSSKEDELTNVIIVLLQDPYYNPYKGTVSVEKIQNIMLSRYPELYAEVVGKKHNSWRDYVERHLDVFQLNNAKDGKLRMTLITHTEWEAGDLREQYERETKEQHLVDCLKAYLQSRDPKQCTVDEFIEEYPSLPQNQIIVMVGGEGSPSMFPELTKKNRGDLVRLVQRHREFKYSRHNPQNTIFLVKEEGDSEAMTIESLSPGATLSSTGSPQLTPTE